MCWEEISQQKCGRTSIPSYGAIAGFHSCDKSSLKSLRRPQVLLPLDLWADGSIWTALQRRCSSREAFLSTIVKQSKAVRYAVWKKLLWFKGVLAFLEGGYVRAGIESQRGLGFFSGVV